MVSETSVVDPGSEDLAVSEPAQEMSQESADSTAATPESEGAAVSATGQTEPVSENNLSAEASSQQPGYREQQVVNTIDALGESAFSVEMNTIKQAGAGKSVAEARNEYIAAKTAEGKNPQEAQSFFDSMMEIMGDFSHEAWEQSSFDRFIDAFLTYSGGMHNTWNNFRQHRESGGRGEVVQLNQIEAHFRRKQDFVDTLQRYYTKSGKRMPDQLNIATSQYDTLSQDDLFVVLQEIWKDIASSEKASSKEWQIFSQALVESMRKNKPDSVAFVDERLYFILERAASDKNNFNQFYKQFTDTRG